MRPAARGTGAPRPGLKRPRQETRRPPKDTAGEQRRPLDVEPVPGSQSGGLADEGVLGRLLTRFLHRNVNDGFAGALPEWETALESLLASLEDLSDCRIPLRMLMAALKCARTGGERHLPSLPLEQRQLLENVQ